MSVQEGNIKMWTGSPATITSNYLCVLNVEGFELLTLLLLQAEMLDYIEKLGVAVV